MIELIKLLEIWQEQGAIKPHGLLNDGDITNLIEKMKSETESSCGTGDVVLTCPFCESENTTVIEAVSDCVCETCGKDFEA